jgi:hypothetical protein
VAQYAANAAEIAHASAISFDVEARLRGEWRENNRDFDGSSDDDNDDSWLLTRFRFGLTVRPARWLKFYAQTQDAREIDSDRPNTPGVRGTQGGDEFDLRQAYLEFAEAQHSPLGLTIGRQRLHYGDRRLEQFRAHLRRGETPMAGRSLVGGRLRRASRADPRRRLQ